MRRSILVRVATLVFAVSTLSAAILYGCSKPAPQQAASNPVASAPSPPSASASEPEPDPAFFGATKSGVMVHPKKNAAPAQQQTK